MLTAELNDELLNLLSCGVVVVGPGQRIEVWNDWMARVSRIEADDAVGRPLSSVLIHLEGDRLHRAVQNALHTGRGALFSYALHGRPLLRGNDAPVHSVSIHCLPGAEPRAALLVRDVTAELELADRLEVMTARNAAQQHALRQEQDRFAQMTHFDPVTGLANRNKVRDYLAGSLTRSRADQRMSALLLLDIDRFADVNNLVGSDIADHVLRLVASRLTDAVRPSDAVARMTGDEFALVIEDVGTIDKAVAAGRRVLTVFDAPFRVESREIFLTASIGVTVFPISDCGADRLLTNAETAVALAKQQGAGGFQLHTGQMDTDASQRLSMYADLRRAIENDEFFVVYQPQVDYPGRRLIGVEALLRWRHPELGTVSPAEFIPILEESGLISQVGAWVLIEACQQGVAWRQQGLPPMRVSVNLSARQFRHDVSQDVAHALAQTGLPAGDLELELTEGLLMNDVDSSKRMLGELKRMGVRIAIDDFGTGYSSLAYLRRFPVDTLKIDRMFTRNVTVSADDLAICRTIVSLGKTLELSILAEGVETRQQLDLLWDTGCDLYQGYYFARPMSAEDTSRWIQQRVDPRLPDKLLTQLVFYGAKGQPVVAPGVPQTPELSFSDPTTEFN